MDRLFIHYVLIEVPVLNRLLIAMTDKGICAVIPGVNDNELEGCLAKNHPDAIRIRVATGHRPWLDTVHAYVTRMLNGHFAHAPILPPLAVSGSPFQWQVWRTLRSIPFAETRSYGQIAATLGQPYATRAVGHACSKNQLALIIPCHRVVCRDGSVGGWRWSVPHKRTLLSRERQLGSRRDE